MAQPNAIRTISSDCSRRADQRFASCVYYIATTPRGYSPDRGHLFEIFPLCHPFPPMGRRRGYACKKLRDGTGLSKQGFHKIRFCDKQARRDSLSHFWVDTCCIDKKNAVELQEAINSMFRWYRNADRCYVYLDDVSYPATPKALSLKAHQPRKRRKAYRYTSLSRGSTPEPPLVGSVSGKTFGLLARVDTPGTSCAVVCSNSFSKRRHTAWGDQGLSSSVRHNSRRIAQGFAAHQMSRPKAHRPLARPD